MKKLIIKDKKLRHRLKAINKQQFIFKSIFNNKNLFLLLRWNAFLKLKLLKSKIILVPRCQKTINKKRFNKLTTFSRFIFLKLIRSGKIYGLKKTSW